MESDRVEEGVDKIAVLVVRGIGLRDHSLGRESQLNLVGVSIQTRILTGSGDLELTALDTTSFFDVDTGYARVREEKVRNVRTMQVTDGVLVCMVL